MKSTDTLPCAVIDAHHHFWKYDAAAYDWIGESMQVLRRDFLPRHLGTEIAASGVAGVVSVQARQTVAETEWLLGLAADHDFIRGVVGWAPLCASGVRDTLGPLAADRKLVGLRHIVQGEPDDLFILREDFNAGIRALGEFGLRYDILIREKHLPQTIRFVDRHPDQVFVVDHAAKPGIRERALEPWASNIRELARRPNVFCKLSGMVTEADLACWTPADLAPYIDTVLEAFTPERLMFGSDWPVCLLGVGYGDWLATVRAALGRLSETEQQRIFAGTATDAYGL